MNSNLIFNMGREALPRRRSTQKPPQSNPLVAIGDYAWTHRVIDEVVEAARPQNGEECRKHACTQCGGAMDEPPEFAKKWPHACICNACWAKKKSAFIEDGFKGLERTIENIKATTKEKQCELSGNGSTSSRTGSKIGQPSTSSKPGSGLVGTPTSEPMNFKTSHSSPQASDGAMASVELQPQIRDGWMRLDDPLGALRAWSRSHHTVFQREFSPEWWCSAPVRDSGLDFYGEHDTWLSLKAKLHIKCTVDGCANHMDEGGFTGEICSACFGRMTKQTAAMAPKPVFFGQVMLPLSQIPIGATLEIDGKNCLLVGAYDKRWFVFDGTDEVELFQDSIYRVTGNPSVEVGDVVECLEDLTWISTRGYPSGAQLAVSSCRKQVGHCNKVTGITTGAHVDFKRAPLVQLGEGNSRAGWYWPIGSLRIVRKGVSEIPF